MCVFYMQILGFIVSSTENTSNYAIRDQLGAHFTGMQIERENSGRLTRFRSLWVV